MSDIMDSNYSQMKSYVERNKFSFNESTENNCKRIDVQHGKAHCIVKVYGTGTIQLHGYRIVSLRQCLMRQRSRWRRKKTSARCYHSRLRDFRKYEKERIPSIDPVIVRFIEEAIVAFKAGSNLGCAFLLGGASERAILLLIDTYAKAIPDERMQNLFISRTSNKFVAKVFDEFKGSWKSSLNKPKGYGWTNDIEIKVEQLFQFCRICRNEAGHPHLPPNLDKGVLLCKYGPVCKVC